MELMKGLRMEKRTISYTILKIQHCGAGFAKRIQKILEAWRIPLQKKKVVQAVGYYLKRTSRIQEISPDPPWRAKREEMVDLTEKLSRRFHINQEAIKESEAGECPSDRG